MQHSIPPDESSYNPAYTKRCSACNLWLPFSKFSPAKTTNDGLHCHCKKCHTKRTSESLTSEQKRDRNYRINYGITAKQYDRMLEQQGGVCACCGQPETRKAPGRNARKHPGKVAPLSLDHDHKTDEVRALLCAECNIALGHMRDDPERIKQLLAYAEWCQTREPDAKIVQLKLVD